MCEVMEFFYFCYAMLSSECYLPNNAHCDRFCTGKEEEQKSFHEEFHNSEHAENFSTIISKLEDLIRNCLPPPSNSNLFCIENLGE